MRSDKTDEKGVKEAIYIELEQPFLHRGGRLDIPSQDVLQQVTFLIH